MRWMPRPRFSLRTLLTIVLLGAVASYYYINTGRRYRDFANAQARRRIDPYELSAAKEACGGQVPSELVAILGESRFGHWDPVFGVKVLVGDRVASNAPDSMARIWDAKSGKQIASFPGGAIGASGNRKTLFVAQPDNIVKYDVATLKPMAKIPLEPRSYAEAISSSHDGTILAWAQFLHFSQTRKNIVWDVAKEKVILELPPKQKEGTSILTGDGKTFIYVDDGHIVIHKLDGSSSDVRCDRITSKFANKSDRSYAAIYSLALSKDEDTVYAGSAMPEIVAFDLATGREIYRSGYAKHGIGLIASWPERRQLVYGFDGDIFFCSMSLPLGLIQQSFISTGNEHVHSFDCGPHIAIGQGHFVALYESSPPHAPCRLQGGEPLRISALVFDPRGRWVFTGDQDGVVTCWKTATWESVRSWKAHERGINHLSVSRDGSRLASVSQDNLAAIWDTATNAEVCAVPAGKKTGVCFSPDGNEFLCSEPEMGGQQPLTIYETETGTLSRKLGNQSDYPEGTPAWSGDGKQIAISSIFKPCLDLLDAKTGAMARTWGKGPIGLRNVAIWFGDSQRLLFPAWSTGDLHVLQVGKPTPLLTIKVGGTPSHVALHPSEKYAAVCGQRMPVQIWDLQKSKLIKSWQIGPHEGTLSAVAFSPDGNYLATVNGNGTAYLLSLDGVLPE